MTDAHSAAWELRALRLFEQCLDLADGERPSHLSSECGSDAELLRRVSQLLEIAAAGRGLDPLLVVPEPERFAQPDQRSVDDEQARQLGPWQLEDRVGVGGMGEVFRGRRSDGAFDRTVAIKRIRPGIATDEILARFKRELRVLAALEHPNIARLLDAGADSNSNPYLVMEFIDGRGIDEYCDEHRLDTHSRIRLFLKVCDAVYHAHSVGVVHRDLKPANILVTPEGEPKLLDFGIAAVSESPQLAGDATLTGDSFGLMTPAYASPEQLRREPLRTASDQYSLGVVLYELLAGVLPHDLSSLSPAEIERVVNREDPIPPSAAAGQVWTQAEAPPEERAKQRHSTVGSMRRTLRGDLDKIVLMALRKEPVRRYATVMDLAADLRRFLEGHPVRARKDTARYRTMRFIQRNRIAVGVTSLVIAAISLALVVALRALGDAEAAGERAETERKSAENAKVLAEEGLADADAVTDFLTDMLAKGDPWQMGKDVLVRDVLDGTAATVDTDFTSRPLIAGRIHLTLGKAYRGLGEVERALAHAKRAHELLAPLLPEEDPRHREAIWVLAMAYKGVGDYVAALPWAERALEITRRLLGEDDITVYMMMNDAAGVLRADRRYERAEEQFRAAIAGMERIAGAEVKDLCQPTNNLGVLLMQVGRYDESREWMERSLHLHGIHYGDVHPETLVLQSNLGLLLQYESRYEESANLLFVVLEKMTEHLGRRHPQTMMAEGIRASSLFRGGREEEAVAAVHEALMATRDLYGDRSLEAAELTLRSAEYELRLRHVGEAEELTYEAMVLFESIATPDDYMRAHSKRAHSVTMRRLGDVPQAIADLEASLSLLLRFRPDDDDVARAYFDLADMWIGLKRYDLAVVWSMEWLGVAGDERVAASDRVLRLLKNLGACLNRSGQLDLAEEYLLETWNRTCDRFGPTSDRMISRCEDLVRFYSPLDLEQADVWRSRLEALQALSADRPKSDDK